MRATIHLVTGDDALALRPLVQPVLDAELVRHRDFAPLLRGVELEPVLAYARTALGERPLTGPQLRAALAERFPLHDAAALGYACRCKLALVQVPPRGVWGKAAQVTVATAESWLGKPLDRSATLDESSSATSPRSGRRPSRTSRRGAASPACARSSSACGRDS